MEKYYSDKKEFYETLLSFLDGDDDSMKETDFFDYLKTKKLDDNKTEMNKFIILLSNISKNHHRSPFSYTVLFKYFANIKWQLKNITQILN